MADSVTQGVLRTGAEATHESDPALDFSSSRLTEALRVARRLGVHEVLGLSDLDAPDLAMLRPDLMLVDVLDASCEGEAEYRLRFVGDRLCRALGCDPNGQLFSTYRREPWAARCARALRQTRAQRRPLRTLEHLACDGEIWRVESLLVPFSGRGKGVDQILMVKIVARVEEEWRH